jgi:hypothetical protein
LSSSPLIAPRWTLWQCQQRQNHNRHVFFRKQKIKILLNFYTFAKNKRIKGHLAISWDLGWRQQQKNYNTPFWM